MNSIISFSVALLFLLMSSPAWGGYVIVLKNGRTITTTKYWKEGGSVKFYWSNGEAGISEGEILSITWISGKKTKQIVSRPEDLRVPVKPVEEIKLKSDPPTKTVDVEAIKKQRDLYMEKYEEAYAKYLEASSQKDKAAKDKARQEFNDYFAQAIACEESLKKSGEAPPTRALK